MHAPTLTSGDAAFAGTPSRESRRPLGQARRDLALVAAITLGTFLLGSWLELSEGFATRMRALESWQVDELPLALVAMLAGLTWYSWRRHRQAAAEMRLRLQAQDRLAATLAENRLLVQRSIQVQEDERRNIARELHDEMGQWLNALKLDAVALRDRADLPEDARALSRAIIEVTNHVYEVARGLMRRLRPVALDELGLPSAVQYLVDQWRRRHPDVRCSFETDGSTDGLGEILNITIYRFVQECLTNVTKHAQAREVRIELRHAAGEGRVSVSVEDDGRGLPPGGEPRLGMGLLGLRERVEILRGSFRLDRGAPSGLRVSASIPV
jgi:glucose-6-phosphate-specific signal transduction histidine kinase